MRLLKAILIVKKVIVTQKSSKSRKKEEKSNSSSRRKTLNLVLPGRFYSFLFWALLCNELSSLVKLVLLMSDMTYKEAKKTAEKRI